MSSKEDEKVTTPSELSHADGADVETSTVNEKALLRKLDLTLLPAVTLLYLLSFLDRANVGNAKVAGLTEAINMCEYRAGSNLTFT